MTKDQEITIEQSDNFNVIYIKLKGRA
jgi:chromatin segregation and condensation protein Rec8/ScpA/Scc1 (kleisin family)